MPKFFQTEIAGYAGEKNTFQNVKFKKRDFNNSDAASSGTILEFIPVHIKNPPVIQFLAYLGTLADTFSAGFKSEQPFGRSDPYHIWSSNKRSISLNFILPSSSVAKGLDNLNNLSWLLASMYPSYKDKFTATSVSASPMFRVRYGNLIASMANGGLGILCIIKRITVTHNHKEGYIGAVASGMRTGGGTTAGVLIKSAGFENIVRDGEKILIPKEIKINLGLDIVHDHAMGWDHQTGHWRAGSSAPGYPYKFGLVRDTKDGPSMDPAGRVEEDTTTPTPAPAVAAPPPGSPQEQQNNVSAQTVVSDTSADVGIESSNVK